eukprot:s1286_g12.t1
MNIEHEAIQVLGSDFTSRAPEATWLDRCHLRLQFCHQLKANIWLFMTHVCPGQEIFYDFRIVIPGVERIPMTDLWRWTYSSPGSQGKVIVLDEMGPWHDHPGWENTDRFPVKICLKA